MRFLWASLALCSAASASHRYLEEAMRGERIRGGIIQIDDEPEWEPSFADESPPYQGHRILRDSWNVTCSSESSQCHFAVDGEKETSWRSEPGQGEHSVIVDLQDWYAVSAVVVLPPVDLQSERGLIEEHRVYVSEDGKEWADPVAYGMWPNTNRVRQVSFEPVRARYVALVAVTSSNTWVGISELNIYANLYTIPQDPAKGRWGPTIALPVVPASAAQEAGGQIMLWSSWGDDRFGATPGGKTAMARWDHRTRSVTKRVVTDTHHDMFCPGIAIDGSGMMVVTGGNDAAQTSLYNAAADKWEQATAMNIERGYQAQTTLADGRVFVIGGSWAGGSNFDKVGEVYNPATRNWTLLPDAKSRPMYTDDQEGQWRADNHGWLFGWKENTVFQAGPSISMHWYDVDKNGSVTEAGDRTGCDDSMSGNAVMFDAVAGKILTFGGSHDYDKDWANKDARIITLGEPNEPPTVEPAGKDGSMTTTRVFHTSVVLPNGNVFIVGGQEVGIAFNEEGVKFIPELYDPKTNAFIPLQKNNLIRVYHSVSILAPDATVLTGGGGLCGNCSANHYDAQVFTPPYLLTESGALRPRPEIALVDRKTHLDVGSRFKFQSNRRISEAALVRISSNTHTVNTDQRRVPLKVKRVGLRLPFGKKTYEVKLPDDAGILIPGQWMLFAMDEAGTPSVATMLLITNSQSPYLADGPFVIDDVVEHSDEEYSHEEEGCQDDGLLHSLLDGFKPSQMVIQFLRQ